MITEWLLSLGSTVTSWFWGLWPAWDVPTWFTGFAGQVNEVLQGINGIGVWAAWPVVIPAITFALLTWVTCLVIKYARAIASYLPFVGGAG